MKTYAEMKADWAALEAKFGSMDPANAPNFFDRMKLDGLPESRSLRHRLRPADAGRESWEAVR